MLGTLVLGRTASERGRCLHNKEHSLHCTFNCQCLKGEKMDVHKKINFLNIWAWHLVNVNSCSSYFVKVKIMYFNSLCLDSRGSVAEYAKLRWTTLEKLLKLKPLLVLITVGFFIIIPLKFMLSLGLEKASHENLV